MDLRTIKNYESWLFDPYFDEETREELRAIKGKETEIIERFYKDLEFGTGGMRGIIGAGTNRINKYTVRRVTQGLANYIKEYGPQAMARGVVIAYDPRHKSKEFSEEAALVLAANGIRVYIFEDIRSTPELSFAIRQLKAISGIVITASHNPPEYNGYKMYWEDGAQIATELAEEIIKKINEIRDFYRCVTMDKEEALRGGILEYIGREIDEAYEEAVIKQALRTNIPMEEGENFKIVFTPLHGTGNIPIRNVLRKIGFKRVFVVPEQELPDPNFSTVAYPNPEEKEAFKLAIDLAQEKDADLIIGTDPDCDRVGALAKDDRGQYQLLTGNQLGALLVDYILSAMKEMNKLASNGIIIKTIVTSEMGRVIAQDYNVDIFNTLTGFKYIGEKIKEFEASGEKTFIFGYEESYGYLFGTYARDKDAVGASMLICEMAAYYASKGMTLYQALNKLYDRYGYFYEDLKSISLEGKEGLEKIQEIMQDFRDNPPSTMAGYKVMAVEDYLKQSILPKENALKFILEGETWVALRPSGTEPKLKIYCSAVGDSLENSRKAVKNLVDFVLKRIG